MKTIYNSIFAILFFLLALNAAAQDTRFTNAINHPLKLNPALMGMNQNFKALLNYRSQWGAMEKGYRTYTFSAMYPVKMKQGDEKLDLGLNLSNDKAGAFGTLDVSLALGYDLQVSEKGHIEFALMGGYVQRSLDNASLTFDEQYINGSFDGSNSIGESISNEKAGFADIGFGAMWYFSPAKESDRLDAFLGASGYHLNEPAESLTQAGAALPRKFSFQGGLKIRGENKLDFTPNVIWNTQGGSNEMAAGTYIDYRVNEEAKITVGGWYRRQDALSFLLGFEHSGFMLAYGYDLTSSDMSRAISGLNTHEITLTYTMKGKATTAAPSFDGGSDAGLSEEELQKKKEKEEKKARLEEQKQKVKEQKEKLKEEKKKLKEAESPSE